MQCHSLQARRARRDGFTLIEILVTVVILSVGIVAVLAALGNAVTALAASRETLVSNRLIVERMDEAAGLAAEAGGLQTGTRGGRVSLPQGDYEWEVVVERVEDLPEIQRDEQPLRESVMAVTVAVQREGSGRSLSAVTYMRARAGGQ